jgi:hypothetical protein
VVLILILNMCVEASNIDARAIIQDAAALRMALAGCGPIDQTKGRHSGKRSASGNQKFTSGKLDLSSWSLSSHP